MMTDTQGSTIDTSNLNKAIEKKSTNVSASKSFSDLLEKMKPQIAKALPKHLTPERMMRVALTAYSRDPKLQECDPMSIIGGIVQASQLGLEVNTVLGQAYLIPYKNKGKMEAQFQTGYKGELVLAYNTGQYEMIAAYEVYANDEFDYELGMEQKLRHKPSASPSGDPVYYYAIYKTINGGKAFFVMSREQVNMHAKKFSQSYKSGFGPWKSDFDAMAKKTCIKKLLSYAPKTIEQSRIFAQDGTIKKSVGEDMTEVPDEVEIDVTPNE
jgi:recombination protein RecT